MLILSRVEYNNVSDIIRDEVLAKQRRPTKETIFEKGPAGHDRIKEVIYRFNMDYLDRLTCTFPQAELSKGVHKILSRQGGFGGRDLINESVPHLRVPGFKGSLWNFQAIGIDWMNTQLDEHGYCMLNDEVGLGKSVQAMAVIKMRKHAKRVLFITTNSGKWAMKKIAHNSIGGKPPMFPTLDLMPVDGTAAARQRQILEGHRVTVVNHEMLRVQKLGRGKHADEKASFPELIEQKWDLVIVDEFHKFKNPDAQQSVGFLRLKTDEMIVMSGTPFINRPEELWTILYKLAPDEWPDDPELFRDSLVYTDKATGKAKAYRSKYVNTVKAFLDDHAIRRRREQVAKDMPQIVSIQKLVELTPEQRRLYDKIRDEFRMELEDGKELRVTNVMAQITRLKQACISPELYGGSSKSAKLDELREIVQQLVDNGEKAIVFSEYKTATRIMQRELADFNPAYVDSTVKGIKRSQQEDKFNEDPDCHLYIGTIRANQEAITLSAATYVIFLDKDWTPLANEQAAGRSAAGGLRGIHLPKGAKVFIIELFAKDTIEEAIEELLKEKRNLFNAFIEKDGGKPVSRSVVKDLMRLMEAA